MLAASWLLSYSAAAQGSSVAVPGGGYSEGNGLLFPTSDWRLRAAAEYSAVAARNVSYNGVTGRSGVQSADVGIGAEVPLGEQWFVPLGLGSRNLFLGTVAGAPIPDQVDTLGFNAGLGYHLNEQWTFAGSLGPRLYRLDDVDSGDVGVGGNVRAIYRWQPNLSFVFGLAFNPDRNVPVLPAAGMHWRISTNLTLNLMFPRSDLEYRVTPRLGVFVAADGDFAVFRTDNHLGSSIGQPRFNNALATYREFRFGVGAEYRLVDGLSAGVEGGFAFGRAIDYKELDQSVKFDPGPYVQASVKWRF